MATRTTEHLRDLAAQQQTTIERAEAAQFRSQQARRQARRDGDERAYATATRSYTVASETLNTATATLKRIVNAILEQEPVPPPPPTRPPPTRPPPASGPTVDPEALRNELKNSVKTSVVTDWGSSIKWPTEQDKRFETKLGKAVLNHQGVGPNGILAQKTAHHVAVNLELVGNVNSRWLAMTYGMDADWSKVWFHKNWDEHAWYDKTCWNKRVSRCYFGGPEAGSDPTKPSLHGEGIGSQALQDVNRFWEMVNPADIWDPYGNGQPAEAVVEDCAFIECGLPTGGRPSYALSYFEPQEIPGPNYIHRNVTVLRSYLESYRYENLLASDGSAWSFGGIMVHAHNQVLIQDTVDISRDPDRSRYQIWGCKGVRIIGGKVDDPFTGKPVFLDVRGEPGCTIEIDGLEGNWILRVLRGNKAVWYMFQDQQIAPYLVLTHNSKTQGKSLKFTI